MFRMTPPPDMDEQPAPEFRRVTGPGYGMIVVASLALLTNCGGILAWNALTQNDPAPARPAGMSDADYESFKDGQKAAPFIRAVFLGVPTILAYSLVFLAGMRMKELRNYNLAYFGSFLVMAPCSIAFLVGLPVGIWSLVVLNDAQVKEAFQPTTGDRR
jgi:hypothetical protein